MTEIESCVLYYGFINSEFVQWGLSDAGHLLICTLEGRYLYIGREKWQHKRTLLGPGKIEFKLAYGGSVFVLAIKMNPIRERGANEALFRSGRNGVFNLAPRPFSSIFRPEHEQIDPDKVWPFSEPENKIARGIAKTAIYLAVTSRSQDNLAITRTCLRGGSFAWMETFGALHTYAIMANGLTKTVENARFSIHKALSHEFSALGFFTVYPAFYELSNLLIEMKKRSGSADLEALGSWALGKAGYGTSAYPREKSIEIQIGTVGEELWDYLGTCGLVFAEREDTGNADWEGE